MRENFKLRKMKVGLVSVAITMLYIMTNGQAEASETNQKLIKSQVQIKNQQLLHILNKIQKKQKRQSLLRTLLI